MSPKNPARPCLLFAGALLALVVSLLMPRLAFADASNSAPSVLVIDSCLGDYDLCTLHWLGEEPEVVAESGQLQLVTSATPAWWGEVEGAATVPATFVLGSAEPGAAITSESIVWALDQIRASGVEPRTFVVAMGATGLPLREYAEDLAATSQGSRADLVGMAFCGTPHNGYTALAAYPELQLWDTVAATIGASTADLAPDSDYLQRLNAGSFPAVCKTLLVSGEVGDLGFGLTDGLSVSGDLALAGTITSQVQRAQVNATAASACNLTGAWTRFVSEIDYPGRTVDAGLTERLSALPGYGTSAEVRLAVHEFYEAWFSAGAPVTHNATALLFDLSGSMNEDIGGGRDKLSAAKEAAKERLLAMQSVGELPLSAPMGISVIGFGETTQVIASNYDAASCDAIEGMTARGETNIGVALDAAMEYLDAVPTCADRHILLLSDGESTRGQTEDEILAGSVARAKAEGIAIDTIGFGDIGESDAGFLKQVSDATGGTYYLAQDTYDLRASFLASYYSSLGLPLVDEEVAATPASVSLGSVDGGVIALEAGIVSQDSAPQVRVLCDGEPLDKALYDAREEYGLVSVQLVSPQPGEYVLELSGDTGPAHVFAVRQFGVVTTFHATQAARDPSIFLLAAAAVVLAVSIAIVAARTLGRRSTNETIGGGGR